MFNVRLAGGHLYWKQLFTWLSLVVSLMASFVLSFFPLDVLDEILDLIESVSERFLTYSWSKRPKLMHCSIYNIYNHKSRKESPKKKTQLSPRSHPRHLVGKKAAQKYAIKDITSDSQVNSDFPYRWSPASLTIHIYFYLFLFLYITGITIILT